MNPRARLQFKVVTSLLIACLGILMFARLAALVPISGATLLLFVAPSLFVVAGLWRALLFLKAVRGLAKP